MSLTSRTLTVATIAVLLLASSSMAENWTQFRGANTDGTAVDAKLPREIAEEKNLAWKIEVPGKGWSSPVTWGNEIWLTTATPEGDEMFVLSYDATSGKQLKNIKVFENDVTRFCHPTNSFASPTPVIEDGRIYVHFGSYGTACLNTKTGEKIWERRDLECNHWRGPGSSPIVDGDNLIVSYDGFDVQYVVAFNKDTGKTEWKQDRNIDYGTDNGDRKKAYGTGQVVEFGGRRQVVLPSAVETISYDPSSGKELWRVRHGGMNAAARPLFGNGLIYIAAGSGERSLIAVRPDGNGDISDSHVEWGSSKSVPRRPSQILIGKRLFMISDQGVASCLDAVSGEIVWQKRAGSGGEIRSSPVMAGGLIYSFSVEGEVVVFAASDEFELISQSKLEDGFQASPAIHDNALIVRGVKHLYKFESK